MSLANRCPICGEIKQNCDCDTNELIEAFIEKLESEGKLVSSDITVYKAVETLRSILEEKLGVPSS